MAVFKCKMCGGALNIDSDKTVIACEYCGTEQTLPRLTDDKRTNLYDRANHFRRENDFDKASGFYEAILSEENDDPEAYWGLVLCRYGVEYVEDPRTHKRLPTINRAQFKSILIDEDYKKALEYADDIQKKVYETEAKSIDKIQKGILEISSKEEPFDIFICYKETDDKGQRTKDSVYAQEIYDALIKEGYKVFFARITLEDKLGSAYEPYIFAALNSAKVMLVVGTTKDNLNSVWVKNEWSRYLAMISQGESKTLIPVYREMDAYDLPEELSYLQSQDMSKIGYLQDLLRGISKVIAKNPKNKESDSSNNSNSLNTSYQTFLDRALEGIYVSTKELMQKGTKDSYNEAIDKFSEIVDYKDSKEQIEICKSEILRIEEEKKLERIAKEKLVIKAKKVGLVLLIIALTTTIIILIITKVIIPSKKYNNAMSLAADGKYQEAVEIFNEIDNFKDSEEQMVKYEIEQIKNSIVGDEVYFGSYEQDNDTTNGTENIEWIVLAKEDSRILVISKYALDCQPYKTDYNDGTWEDTDVTWETCSLRIWLHGTFLFEAFSESEQAKIPIVTVIADENQNYDTDPGNDTQDRIFLLSIAEAEQYFDSDEDRMCAPTDHAIAQDARTNGNYYTTSGETACWWLRSPGNYVQSNAAIVDYDGTFPDKGSPVYDCSFVRPAMWIDLSAAE